MSIALLYMTLNEYLIIIIITDECKRESIS